MRYGFTSSTSSRRRATLKPDATPTWWRVPAVVEEAEEERAHALAVLVGAEAGDDAVGRALVLHLEHDALVGEVVEVRGFGDDPIEAGALEARRTSRRRRRGPGWPGVRWTGGLAFLRSFSSILRRCAYGVSMYEVSSWARRSKATNEAGVASASWLIRLAAGWMRWDSASKSSPLGAGDDDLAVEDAAVGELTAERVDELGEVSSQGLLVAAAELDVVAVAEDDAAEPVPFGLVVQVRRPGAGPG